jgi:hypothetical protein
LPYEIILFEGDKKMHYSGFLVSFLLIFIYRVETTVVDNDDEFLWSNSMGNARNTRRLIPSLPTEYNKNTWNYVFNSSSQDATVFGAGVGINGDLYSYISDSRYSSGIVLIKYYFC